MNLRHLEFFVELAKTEHMAKAAKQLGVSQPTLSYAIASIEKELGVPLFEKNGRNIRLTNYGQIYLKYVNESLLKLHQGSECIADLVDTNGGHINLGFTFTLGQDIVPRLISKYYRKNQSKKGQFSFTQGTTADLSQALLRDQLDLVFSSMPTDPDIQSKLNIVPLVDQEMLAIVPNDNPLSKKRSVSLNELVQYPFIDYAAGSSLHRRIHKILDRQHVKPNVLTTTEEEQIIIGFVHYGFGVAIIPHFPQLDSSFVKQLHIKDGIAVHHIYAMTKKNHFVAPAINNFQAFSQKYCQEQFNQQNKLL